MLALGDAEALLGTESITTLARVRTCITRIFVHFSNGSKAVGLPQRS